MEFLLKRHKGSEDTIEIWSMYKKPKLEATVHVDTFWCGPDDPEKPFIYDALREGKSVQVELKAGEL